MAPPKVFRLNKRCRRIQAAHGTKAHAFFDERLDSMRNNWNRASVIVRKVGRTRKRDLSPPSFGYSRDFFVVGRNDNSIKTAALLRSLDRPSNHGFATKFLDVLSRNTLTSATRRDRKSTRLNSSHVKISYAVFCLKKKNTKN